MIENIKDLSEDDLVGLVGQVMTGTSSSLIAQQAQAELIRRQIVEMRTSSAMTKKHNAETTALTLVLFMVAIVQTILAVLVSDKNPWLQLVLIVGVGGWIIYFFIDMEKIVFRKNLPK